MVGVPHPHLRPRAASRPPRPCSAGTPSPRATSSATSLVPCLSKRLCSPSSAYGATAARSLPSRSQLRMYVLCPHRLVSDLRASTDSLHLSLLAQNVYVVAFGTVVGHSCCTALAVMGGRYVSTKISVKHGEFFRPKHSPPQPAHPVTDSRSRPRARASPSDSRSERAVPHLWSCVFVRSVSIDRPGDRGLPSCVHALTRRVVLQ